MVLVDTLNCLASSDREHLLADVIGCHVGGIRQIDDNRRSCRRSSPLILLAARLGRPITRDAEADVFVGYVFPINWRSTAQQLQLAEV